MLGSFRGTVAEARCKGDLYFAALLPEEYILKVLGGCKTNLARMDLHAFRDEVDVFVAVSQRGSFVPGRDAVFPSHASSS